MKLTTRSRYGTRMILDMAQHSQNGPVRIKDIAARQGVSVKYLEKLVRELKAAGFVKSRRGPRAATNWPCPWRRFPWAPSSGCWRAT
jgi:Rrf2 family protein